jgi:hypothetical protein
MATVRVRQGAKVLGTHILTLPYDHTLDQVFHLWNQRVKPRKMVTPLNVYGMKYDAQKGDQQLSDLSTMNELDMEMTVRDTIPFGLQAFLYFVEGRTQEIPPSLEQASVVGVLMAQARSLCDNFLPKISTDLNREDSVKNYVIIFLASTDAYFTKAEEQSECRIIIQCTVTIVSYVNGQQQKFKDAPTVTALPESLVFPQIKKTAWMGKEKRKLVLRQHSLKYFSEDLSTILHNTKRVKTDEWKTVRAVLYHLKLSLDTMLSYLKSQSDVAVTTTAASCLAITCINYHYMHCTITCLTITSIDLTYITIAFIALRYITITCLSYIFIVLKCLALICLPKCAFSLHSIPLHTLPLHALSLHALTLPALPYPISCISLRCVNLACITLKYIVLECLAL